jgi:hypothetical protein
LALVPVSTALPCYPDASAWGTAYWISVVGCWVLGFGLYLGISQTTRRGKWWVLVGVVQVWAAIAFLALLALLVERRSVAALYNPLHGSFALVYLDPYLLPALIAWCGLSWPLFRHRRRWHGPAWFWICAIIGIAAAYGFHESALSAYNVFQAHSPTNLWHDFTIYFGLTGSCFYLALPVLCNPRAVKWWRWFVTWALIVGVLVLLWHEWRYHLPGTTYHAQVAWNHAARAFSCPER